MQNWTGKIGILFGLLSFVAVLIAGCVSSSGGKNDGVIAAPKPTRAMAEATGNDLDELGRGYVAFVTQCGQCHDYMLPDDLSRAAWHKANWSAGMEKKDEQALVKYLLAEIATR